MDKQLADVALSQGRWSATANRLKKSFEATRFRVFVVSILAALAAAVSSQQPNGPLRTLLAIVSTTSMAAATFLTARLLDSKHSQAWVRARAASEALKREGYKSAALAEPYNDPNTRASILRSEAQKIEADVDDLTGEQDSDGRSSLPTDLIKPDEYLKKRVEDQINYYEQGAKTCKTSASTFRTIEFSLALVTAVLTAVVGVFPKVTARFDLVALTAVLTTLSGAILAYIEASRYDFSVATYRAAARRLRDQHANPPANPQPGTPEWSAYVNACEAILQEQNSSWVAKFGKPA